MRHAPKLLVWAALSLSASLSLAQPAPGTPAPGPAPGATPKAGPGPGPGGGRWGREYSHGWALMKPEERAEHRKRMQSMKTYEDCKTYMDQHREQMSARAKAQGGQPMPTPRRDACAGLKK
jgi:hypothetical protein